MNSFLPHLFYFLALAVPIVIMGAFYSHAEDEKALRSVPKRYVIFVLSCAAVALVMLLLEMLFASVD